MTQIQIKLTEPQLRFVNSPAKYPAIIGGLGSGKTQAGIARALSKLFLHPGYNVGYYMPTYDLIKLRAMEGFESFLHESGLGFNVNRSEYIISVSGFGSVILRSYDRPERIIAYEVAHSVVDELDTIPKDKAKYIWQKVTERNRQGDNDFLNTIGNVTTPDQGVNGFAYSKWGKPKADYELISAPTYSNPFLPDGYVEQIRENYDPITADAMIEGKFVSFNMNRVYHYYDKKKHDTDRIAKEGDQLHIGQDFNIGGCVSTVFVIDNGKPIAVDEFVSNDTQDLVNNITKRYKDRNNVIVYPDASGGSNRTNSAQSDIDILRYNKVPVYCKDKNPPVRDRVNSLNALFAHDRIRINSKKCPELSNSLLNQGYNDKGEPEKFNEHPSMDDYNDSTGYFIYYRFPIRSIAESVRRG